MPQKFYKHKLILDEGFYYRQDLPHTNSKFAVKHIVGDYGQSALPDPKVYKFAGKEGRILVTFNIKHFKPLVSSTKSTGVIGISSNLTLEQIDKKLTALLTKSSPKALFGKITFISGETT